MYIAFKWLVGLALAMWGAMCGIDLYVTKNVEKEGTHATLFGFIYKNITVEHKLDTLMDKYPKETQQGVVAFNFLIFLSGAVAVSIIHRKNEIISFTKSSIPKININKLMDTVRQNLKLYWKHFKIAAKNMCVVIVKINTKLWQDAINLTRKNFINMCDTIKTEKVENRQGINCMLLKKLKEIGEERKNLGELLIAAIQENKNIRMHYQLENMAKNRLVRHIENTQKEIKENRSKYVSFQQLYLVTHQENSYLKSRVRKLIKDKEEAEKNLMELFNEIYKSKNNELKAFCSRFIVKTKDNLLNSNVGEEIQKFLHKSQGSVASTSNHQTSEYSDIENDDTNNWPSRGTGMLQNDEGFDLLVSEAPKLKGLPGEYIWTVKDKHGIIEKLYEYDYESNINVGDTIKRIRQYSVYYDKDCLLDFSKSKPSLNEVSTEIPNQFVAMDYPVTKERFLTGSEAFQKFLQTNSKVVSITRSPAPPLLCR